jgi:hypothetical protein
MEPTRKHREMACLALYDEHGLNQWLTGWVASGDAEDEHSFPALRLAQAFATFEAELRAELAQSAPAVESPAAWAVRCLDAWRARDRGRYLDVYSEAGTEDCSIGICVGQPVTPSRFDFRGNTDAEARIFAARALCAEDASLPQPPEET